MNRVRTVQGVIHVVARELIDMSTHLSGLSKKMAAAKRFSRPPIASSTAARTRAKKPSAGKIR
jgi:hypothetical protein